MGKQKFYVVWEGGTPGIYTSGQNANSKQKVMKVLNTNPSVPTKKLNVPFIRPPYAYIGKNAVKTENKHKPSSEVLPAAVVENSLAVDAAS